LSLQFFDLLQAGAHLEGIVLGIVQITVDVDAEQFAGAIERQGTVCDFDTGIDVLDLEEVIQVVAKRLFDEQGIGISVSIDLLGFGEHIDKIAFKAADVLGFTDLVNRVGEQLVIYAVPQAAYILGIGEGLCDAFVDDGLILGDQLCIPAADAHIHGFKVDIQCGLEGRSSGLCRLFLIELIDLVRRSERVLDNVFILRIGIDGSGVGEYFLEEAFHFADILKSLELLFGKRGIIKIRRLKLVERSGVLERPCTAVVICVGIGVVHLPCAYLLFHGKKLNV